MNRIENIYEVTQRLCGIIEPVGESHVDSVRYENLEQTIDVAERLINDIVGVATNQNRPEYSMRKAGIRADEFLMQLKEQLSHY